MNTEDLAFMVFFLIISIVSCVIGILQLKQKGFLLNNAYIFATREERETINFKPYYIQSGVVFCLIGIIFIINATEMILKTGWLFYVAIIMAVILIIYAIVSTIIISCKLNTKHR